MDNIRQHCDFSGPGGALVVTTLAGMTLLWIAT
jgi:hypothetical protein